MPRGVPVSPITHPAGECLLCAVGTVQISFVTECWNLQQRARRARLIETSIYRANKVEFAKLESRPVGKSDGQRRPDLIQPCIFLCKFPRTHQRLGFPVWVGSEVSSALTALTINPHGPAETISYTPGLRSNKKMLMRVYECSSHSAICVMLLSHFVGCFCPPHL